MPTLLITSGKQKGKKLRLPENRDLVVGRDRECHIRLTAANVSRKHCAIRSSGNQLFVRDLGSGNGTLVNDIAIQDETLLQPGDVLAIGAFVFQVPKPMQTAETTPDAASVHVTDGDVLDWLGAEEPQDAPTPESTIIIKGREQITETPPDRAAAPRYAYLHVRELYEIAIVRLKAKRIDAGNFEKVMQELSALVDREGHKKILLNLAEVSYVYTTALTRFSSFKRKVEEAGGQLRLCDLQPVVRDVFEVTQLSRLFDIHDRESGALDALW